VNSQALGDLPAAYRLALERRLGRTTFLGLTGVASYQAYVLPVSSNETPPTSRNVNLTTSSVGGLLGIRQIVVEDLVELSFQGAFVVARSATNGDPLQPGESTGFIVPGSHSLSWGFSGGVSVERELIESLSLRLSSDIASIVGSRSTTAANGLALAEQRSTAVRLSFAPALDLRFYF
jgi:hypothetical protein